MNNKIAAALASIAALLLAALFALALLAGQKQYENLLLITPSKPGAQSPDIQKLEELCEDEFLVTYEIRREETVRAVNSGHQVTLVGANSRYRDIMCHPMADGGFFTKAAWDAKSKNAVLNETAASRLFGSKRVSGQTIQIKGETWLVTGVIRDGDEEAANVYVPSSVSGGQPQALMALMDGKVTETYVINALKSLGIQDTGYLFVNLSKASLAFRQHFSVARKTALCAALILLARWGFLWLASQLRTYNQALKEMYPKDLFAKHRADILKTAMAALLSAAGCAAALELSRQILATCLTWHDLQSIDGGLPVLDFQLKLLWLREHQTASIVLFAAFSAVLVLLFAYGWRKIKAGHRDKAGRVSCSVTDGNDGRGVAND